jgi:hypothetical protein
MVKRLVLLLAITALGACSRPAPPPPPAAAPAPTLKGPTAKEIYELRERCAKDAREWFKQNYSEPQEPIPVTGGGSVASVPPTYENHYSQAQNACFAVLSQMTSFTYSAKQASKNNLIQSNTLWDVNENSQLGAFVVKNFNEVTACKVVGTQCMTKEQWMDLARPYLVE